MLELAAVALVSLGGLIALVGLVGFALPAPLVRVAAPRTRLDAVMPAYHFHEVHALRVRASPARVLEAFRAVTAGEIRLFRTLTWIRSPRRGRARESILNPPRDQPILDVALRSGFVVLGDEPGREIVFGAALRLGPRGADPPRFARTAMNFLAEEEDGGWCRLTTETRVFGTDDGARRRFAVYWRVIHPGSALIRRMWLRAVKARAEAG